MEVPVTFISTLRGILVFGFVTLCHNGKAPCTRWTPVGLPWDVTGLARSRPWGAAAPGAHPRTRECIHRHTRGRYVLWPFSFEGTFLLRRTFPYWTTRLSASPAETTMGLPPTGSAGSSGPTFTRRWKQGLVSGSGEGESVHFLLILLSSTVFPTWTLISNKVSS